MNPQKKKFWVGTALLALTFLSTSVMFWIEAVYLSAIGSTMIWVVGQAVLYQIYYVGVKPRYPLGVADQDDIYFPRFNIPRPLYLDERKRRERERKMNEIERQEKSEQVE